MKLKINELSKLILSNIDSFDILLRNNFDFENVKYLHNNVLNYKKMEIDLEDELIWLTLQNCCEIQDYIVISIKKDVEINKKILWKGITLYGKQFIEEMD